jgi:hypothetical protein
LIAVIKFITLPRVKYMVDKEEWLLLPWLIPMRSVHHRWC